MMDDLSSDDAAVSRIGSSLELLADMGRDFAGSGDIDGTLGRALQRITDYLDAEGGALFLLEDEGRILTCHSCVGQTEITGITLKSDHGIVGRCVQTNTGEIVRDVALDPSFDSSVDEQTGFTTKSILCAPLSIKDEVIGSIELINKKGGDNLFDEGDLTLLEVLSSSAALAILNARMSEKLVEQEKVRRELELAAEIQRNLLPAEREDGFPVAGINIPARTVSGDFYDFFPLEDGRIVFCLGDVSGKGINAALLMAKTASLFRCLGKTILSPGKLLGLINAEICETSTRGMFVTMVAGNFDPESNTVCIANAGHEPPLFMADGALPQSFEADAPPIGISTLVVPEEGYPEEILSLDQGSLYIFTDGVTEGTLEDGSMLGVEGVVDILNDGAGQPLATRLGAIVARVHRGDGDLHDDLTILGVSQARAVMSGRDLDAPILNKTVSAQAKNLKAIRTSVKDALAEHDIGEEISRDVVLVINEACQNIIRHAYGHECEEDISLEILFKNNELSIDLRDQAPPADLDKIKPRQIEDIKPGGLGTHFISEIMDEVTYSHRKSGQGNKLHMLKRTT